MYHIVVYSEDAWFPFYLQLITICCCLQIPIANCWCSLHEMCAPQHTNGASKPQQTDHRNVHLLDAPGASAELQPNTAAVKSRFLQQQCNLQPPAINSGAAEEWVPISDTWGSTLFGSPQKAAEAGSKQKGLAGPLGHLHSTVNEVGHSLLADGRSPTSKKRPQSILTSGGQLRALFAI